MNTIYLSNPATSRRSVQGAESTEKARLDEYADMFRHGGQGHGTAIVAQLRDSVESPSTP